MCRVSVIWIVVLAVLGVLLVLALAGAVGASRRNRAQAERFVTRLSEVDRQLAAALAQDRGWEPAMLDAAARKAFDVQRPGVEIATLELVQVVDEPGTDEDRAIFRVVAGATGEASRIELGRRSGAWYAAAVEDEH
jgi:type II secretory pathway pseudopilin PulG